MARALGVLGAGVALTLLGPFGAINAGTTETFPLTVEPKWPGIVVVRRAGLREVRCDSSKVQRQCRYMVRAGQETTLRATLRGNDTYSFQFTRWIGISCLERGELRKVCTLNMPHRNVNADAIFDRVLAHTQNPSGGGIGG